MVKRIRPPTILLTVIIRSVMLMQRAQRRDDGLLSVLAPNRRYRNEGGRLLLGSAYFPPTSWMIGW